MTPKHGWGSGSETDGIGSPVRVPHPCPSLIGSPGSAKSEKVVTWETAGFGGALEAGDVTQQQEQQALHVRRDGSSGMYGMDSLTEHDILDPHNADINLDPATRKLR